MKYVLVNTAYRMATLTVDERYFRKYDENEIGRTDWFEDLTLKLSLARIWDSRSSADDFMFENKITDHKIVHITEAKLFKAMLEDK